MRVTPETRRGRAGVVGRTLRGLGFRVQGLGFRVLLSCQALGILDFFPSRVLAVSHDCLYLMHEVGFILLFFVSVYKVPFLNLVSVQIGCPYGDTRNVNPTSYHLLL